MKRVLMVFDWLFISAEETECRHLRRRLNPAEAALDIVTCYRNPLGDGRSGTEGWDIDDSANSMDDDARVRHLAEKAGSGHYDMVVAWQGTRPIHAAYDLIPEGRRPPLVEHGSQTQHVFANIPKNHTNRFVAASRSVFETAAMVVPPELCRLIPSMVDLSEFAAHDRAAVRAEIGAQAGDVVCAWVGRLDHKNRAEEFLAAAAEAAALRPELRFLMVGATDRMNPQFAQRVGERAAELGLADRLTFLTDRRDVPRLLAGCDLIVWLASVEGMPHVVAEAGAARLAVIGAHDGARPEQIEDNLTGLLVPEHDRAGIVGAMVRLADDPEMRVRLGNALHDLVAAKYDVSVVIPQWRTLFDELVREQRPRTAVADGLVAEPAH